jgi:hypothetical protein
LERELLAHQAVFEAYFQSLTLSSYMSVSVFDNANVELNATAPPKYDI